MALGKLQSWTLLAGFGLAAAIIVGCGGSGNGGGNGSGSTAGTTAGAGNFVQTNMVADTAAAGAAVVDPNLVNPWGVSFNPSGPFWVSDNGTGVSTLYNTAGQAQALVVQIPKAGGGNGGPVTGQVFNSTTDFAVGGSAAFFIFSSEDGIISAWNAGQGTQAAMVADRSGSNAIYKGLAMGSSGGNNFLFATDFHNGHVDVFDKNFAFVKSFTDPSLPAGFAPFGIATIGAQLYVTLAKQDGQKEDDVAGPGNGYVDVFTTDGTFVKRLVSKGALNSPWGLAVAPAGFGAIGGDLLVGNFGDGKINVYNATSGASVGAMKNATGGSLVIDGLWGLIFGNGGSGGNVGTLYFTAGPGHEAHGLLGSLTAQ
ncbi:MAG TPA: TIGR03118 family protein [Fimbriimonas sp.]|nr:TIGR03118 family protein [Fimbriimonas sp.]